MNTLIGAGEAKDAGGGQSLTDLIKDGDTGTFTRDVIEASKQVPIIVDFWAPWCGPCKQLGPLLEKMVTAARGGVRLVKINVDQNQTLAGQLRIQSIPAVFAFFQGQPVDGFVGAQSESQIKAFVNRLLSQGGAPAVDTPVQQALEQAQVALDEHQSGAASALFGQVLQHEPENETALAGLVRCYLESGDHDGARRMFDSLPEGMAAKPAFASVSAALDLADQGANIGPISELRDRVERDPLDHQARFDLALALHAAGEREAAADALFVIIEHEPAWNDQAARQQLVKFFEAWGQTDPLTVSTRRRLSSQLFS